MEHGDLRGLNAAGSWSRELTGKATIVESALAPCDLLHFFGAELPRPIPMGSWIVAIFYRDPQLWTYLRATPHGISWRGLASKEPAQ